MGARIMKSRKIGMAAALAALVSCAGGAQAQVASTSTTTTIFTGTTTTTMFVPTDVTGGGQFEGGFPIRSFDSFVFALEEPKVLVVEVSNGVGGCPGDSLLELRRPGAPSNCQGTYGDALPCVAFDDDSGPSVCSLLVKKILLTGDYEIRVAGYAGASIPRYFLDVEFLDPECGNGVLEASEQCDDGNLSNGDCCSSTCSKDAAGTSCSDGLFCNGADTCSSLATCTIHAGDPCPGPDGDSDCTETCSETADACSGADPAGTTCQDGLFCNGDDFCAAGACSVHDGDPCAGPDGDADCTETCDEGADSCTGADPNASPCDDGLFCNGSDTCSAGACTAHAGDPCDGADGDLNCAETCDEAADVCGADPDGSACDDGLACNGDDTCTDGRCSAHEATACAGIDGDADCAESCSDSQEGCGGSDPQGAPCDDGIFCNGPDFCSNGSCSVHAGDPCPGPDGDSNCVESCNEGADACTAPDPAASPCNDGLFCNGSDSCSAGACSAHTGSPCDGADGDANCSESCSEAADACTAADANGSACSDGLFCNGADVCVSGFCSGHAGDPCPGPDGDGNCAEACSESSDACSRADPTGSVCDDGLFCNGIDACVSGACTRHSGNPCDGADGDIDCSEGCNETSNNCSAADTAGSACDDAVFCNGADTCSMGSCLVHTGNPCGGPDGDANCSESCSEAAETCTGPDVNGSVCNDGLFCNGADRCSGGSCSTHLGGSCPGADGDGNCKESCDEASDGCMANDAEGSVCNDGVFCNGPDRCASGSCTFHEGNPCPGADGDSDCSEACNEVPDTCTSNDPGGSACDDGLFCNGADSCSAGACSVHTGSPCPGPDGDANCAESCSEAADACGVPDSNGAPCNDGLFCNGADTCQGGLCSQHAGSPCAGPDGDANCSESCNEATDTCTAPDPDMSLCTDSLFCTGVDRCSAGSCTLHTGSPCAPPDGDGNCSESCNEAADACSGADPNGSACNDGLFCNGADTCADGVCGGHTGDPCPGADSDLDCSETCSEAADACTGNDPTGSACEDGLACNGSDSCIAGLCNQHSGSVCPGADGDGDCTESCSDSTGGCVSADPAGSPCDDGIFCNGADSCSNGSCSVHAGDPCAGPDGDSNCAESCSEQNDACNAPDPASSACDDGAFCNGTDSCAAGACTVHAGDPCSGPDGDEDCHESCDEKSDACSAADTDGSACTDGLFCTGADSCQSGACTGHAGDPCPGPDGDGNCAESCNEAAGNCSASDAAASPCDDALFCNGADTCAEGACSQHAGSPCPGADGDADCSETCNEASDACTAADPNASPCDDALYCNGTDTCAGGTCSVHAAKPCNDDDLCTSDSCSEPDDECFHSPIDPCGTTTTTLPAGVCGDATGDGSVKAADALAVLRAAVGGNQCTSEPCVCDVNGSGSLSASDALLVLRAAVGAPVTLACPC
jgi:hypothetical protein